MAATKKTPTIITTATIILSIFTPRISLLVL
jgi:hypothetical protein